MTRGHFAALANALRETRPDDAIRREQWRDDVSVVADVCEKSNVLFDRERFLEACGF